MTNLIKIDAKKFAAAFNGKTMRTPQKGGKAYFSANLPMGRAFIYENEYNRLVAEKPSILFGSLKQVRNEKTNEMENVYSLYVPTDIPTFGEDIIIEGFGTTEQVPF